MRRLTPIALPTLVSCLLAALLILLAPPSRAQVDAAVAERQTLAPAEHREMDPVIGITAPAQEATLASVHAARIAQILADEGVLVHSGDVVLTLEDEVQRAKTEIARAAAESTLEVDLARARWEKAKRDLDRLVRLRGGDHASSKELSDAMADADITRIEHDLAKFAHEQARRAYEREQAFWGEFRIRAPFSGYVSEHIKRAGETVDQLEGILTLVQLDPLLVLLDCPLEAAPSLRVGDEVLVRPVDAQWPPRAGQIVLASRVADGASQTFRVKITVDNADVSWMVGLKVIVEFSTDAESAHKPRPGAPSAADQDDLAWGIKTADSPRR